MYINIRAAVQYLCFMLVGRTSVVVYSLVLLMVENVIKLAAVALVLKPADSYT